LTLLRSFLDQKLAESFAEEWDPARPTRAEVIESDGSLGLRFFVRKADGSWIVFYEEPAVPLTTNSDVDDLLARGLSVFLMKHPAWPR
jgi:hypothetical protein